MPNARASGYLEMKEKIKCQKCGNTLEWEDTIDHDGGLWEEYLQELQLWSCSHCQIDYVVDAVVHFKPENIAIIKIQES